MTTEENKALARRSWEIVNQRNPDLIEEVYPPDFVWHEPEQDLRGYEQAKQFVSSFFAAFPDLNISVDDVIAEGEKAVSRYTATPYAAPTKERQRSLALPLASR